MSHLTIGQLADLLHEPDWKVRREVDSLGVVIPRAGLYRLVPRDLVPRLIERLGQRHQSQDAVATSEVTPHRMSQQQTADYVGRPLRQIRYERQR